MFSSINDEAGPGKDLVLSPGTGKITQYHAVVSQWIKNFWFISYVHQLYTSEIDLGNNFLSNIVWKAMYSTTWSDC